MNAKDLIESMSPVSLPAPVWFVQFFKASGFHAARRADESLVRRAVGGPVLARGRSATAARRFAGRLLRQMPVIVAVGVNLGIVPLLFVQLAYYKVFYPATILMAWFWLAIIGLLIPAYYGVYAYAWGFAARWKRCQEPFVQSTRRAVPANGS